MRSARTVLALTVAAVLVVVTAGAATAGWLLDRDDEVVDRTSCAGVLHELSVEQEDGDDGGGREASYELQSSAGETWSVLVEQDGQALLDAERTTDDEGELDLDVPVADETGHELTVTAEREGRSCAVAVRW